MKLLTQTPLRFAIADDHLIFRHGLINLLNSVNTYPTEFVLEAPNGQELLAGLDKVHPLPDVCLLDINMGPMNAYITTEKLRARWPELGIIILTAYNSTENMFRLFDLGANAFLTKNCHPAVLTEALLEVKEKGFYLNNLPAKVVRDLQRQEIHTPPLTATELRFLELCAQNKGYAEIAACMNTSVTTVYGYRNRLFTKLNIRSRVGLAFYALRCGFMPPDLNAGELH